MSGKRQQKRQKSSWALTFLFIMLFLATAYVLYSGLEAAVLHRPPLRQGEPLHGAKDPLLQAGVLLFQVSYPSKSFPGPKQPADLPLRLGRPPPSDTGRPG